MKRIRKRLQEGEAVGVELEALRQLDDELAVHGWLKERLEDEGSVALLEDIAGASSARDVVERFKSSSRWPSPGVCGLATGICTSTVSMRRASGRWSMRPWRPRS